MIAWRYTTVSERRKRGPTPAPRRDQLLVKMAMVVEVLPKSMKVGGGGGGGGDGGSSTSGSASGSGSSARRLVPVIRLRQNTQCRLLHCMRKSRACGTVSLRHKSRPRPR